MTQDMGLPVYDPGIAATKHRAQTSMLSCEALFRGREGEMKKKKMNWSS